mgnify:CR=1 FL=1
MATQPTSPKPELHVPANPVRIVTASALFDGHDASINIMRRIMQSQGAEVIHLGHNRSVQEVVDAAVEEDVQGVAVSSYQGGHVEYFEYLVQLLAEAGAGHVQVVGGGGGVIVPEEIERLRAAGVTIFSPQDGQRLGLPGMVNQVIAACDVAMRLAQAARPGLTVNPARIEGGAPNNVVPDRTVLHFNIRPLTPADEADAAAIIDRILSETARRHNVMPSLTGSFGRPPKPFDPGTERLFELVRRCGDDLGIPVEWKPGGGVCDGNNIAGCGVPVIDTMGVRGGSIHSSEEYLIVASLAERARLSALTLLRLAQGGLP